MLSVRCEVLVSGCLRAVLIRDRDLDAFAMVWVLGHVVYDQPGCV
jgi:hypothetical protein